MPMKDFSTAIKTLDGEVVKNADGKEHTMKRVCVDALLVSEEKGLSGEEKVKRYALALKLNNGGKQEISPEEIVLLKQLIGKAYGPLVVGQAYEFLDK